MTGKGLRLGSAEVLGRSKYTGDTPGWLCELPEFQRQAGVSPGFSQRFLATSLCLSNHAA